MAGFDPSLALGERIENDQRAIFLDLSPSLIGTKVMPCQESATFNCIEESYKQCLGNHRLRRLTLWAAMKRVGSSFQPEVRHLERIPVTLSAAKGLARRTQRSFAALRMTGRIPLTRSLLSKCLARRPKNLTLWKQVVILNYIRNH